MSQSPFRPCGQPGCPELVRGAPRCPKHTAKREAEIRADDRQRGSATARGYDARWSAFSRWYRAAHPLCAECQRQGRVRPSEVTDHIRRWQSGKTPEDRERLKYAPENLQALCKGCHNSKTAERDGAFGNPRR